MLPGKTSTNITYKNGSNYTYFIIPTKEVVIINLNVATLPAVVVGGETNVCLLDSARDIVQDRRVVRLHQELGCAGQKQDTHGIPWYKDRLAGARNSHGTHD